MQHHRDQSEEHSEDNRAHENRVDRTDARQRDHFLARSEPERRYDFLESENTSEHEPEYRREDSGHRDNSRKVTVLLLIQQESSYHEAESLTDIAVHDTENKRIRDGHKDRRIELIVIRQTIHFDIHFIWSEKSRILEFRRRLHVHLLLIFLDKADYFRIIGNVISEFLNVIRVHPSAQNVEGILLRLGTCRHAAYIKIGGQILKLLLRCQKAPAFFIQKISHLAFYFTKLLLFLRHLIT